MKKILIIIVLLTLSFITIISNDIDVNAYSAGSGYYGTDMTDYEIIEKTYKYTKGNRIPVWIGGTDKYEYYTYYLYAKLRVNTVGLTNTTFKEVKNGKIVGAFEESITLEKEYSMKTSIGYEVIEGASINLALENYQAWGYRHAQGEEMEFNVSNRDCNYFSVAVISLEIKLVERYVLEEVKYGGFTGKVEKGRTLHDPVFEEYYFVYDYDLMPISYDDLKSTDKNKYKYQNGEYQLNLTPSEMANMTTPYAPDVNSNYIEFIMGELKKSYYAK